MKLLLALFDLFIFLLIKAKKKELKKKSFAFD